jgi:serine phosphatase RsbU (regulator of sigma subunit)
MRRRLGITKKFILIYLIISIPLVLIIATVYRNWYNAEIRRVLLERTTIARSAGTSFTLLITELGRTMRHMGREVFVNRYSSSQILPVLMQLIDDYPVSCAVITTGNGIVSNSTDTHLVGMSLATDKAFRQVIYGHKDLGIGNSQRSRNGVGFYVAQAIYSSDGKLLGVMGSFVGVGKLHNEFPFRINRGGINIVDASGYLIYQSEFPELAQNRSYWGEYDFVRVALSGKNSVGRFEFPLTGAYRLVSEVPIKEFGWAVGSGVNFEDSIQPILRSTIYSALLALLTLVIAATISFFIARGIIYSLTMIVAKSRAIGKGQLDESVVLRTGDEIEDVAVSLDEARVNLKRSIDEINAISQIADVAISTLDLDRLFNRLLERLIAVTGADAAVILLKEGKRLVAKASVGLEEEVQADFSVLIGTGFAGTIARTLQPYYIEDAQEDARIVNPVIVKRGIRSMLGMPLVIGNNLIGVIHIDWLNIHPRDSREVHLLDLVADRVALAISNAQLYARTEEELSRTRLLQGIATVTSTSPNVQTAAERILDELWDHMHIKIGVVHVLDEEKGVLRLLASLGLNEAMIKEVEELTLVNQSFLTVRVLKSKRIMTHNDETVKLEGAEFVRGSGFEETRYAVIPFAYKSRVFGTVSISFEGRRDFTNDELELFGSIGSIIGQAFENARLFEIEQNIADTLQEALLTIPEKIGGIEFGHFYRSAAEAALVGGDFYDLFELEHDKIGIVIGDVSGKGVEAATITSIVKNAIKAFSYEYETPDAIIARTNDLIVENTSANIFVTVFLGILDTNNGDLSYCSAGHPPAIVKRGLSVEFLQEHSPIIGAFPGISYVKSGTTLLKRDILVLYTDGIIEARRNSDFYGENRLVDLLKHLNNISAKELPQEIFNDVLGYAKGVTSDDIAVLAVSLEAG